MARLEKPMTQYEHPTKASGQEMTRHQEDAFLRRMGFAIHLRPNGSMALWKRNGEIVCHFEALRLAREESAGNKA